MEQQQQELDDPETPVVSPAADDKEEEPPAPKNSSTIDDAGDCCFLCDRVATRSGKTALMAPCRCTTSTSTTLGDGKRSSMMLVHRSCHNRLRRTRAGAGVIFFPNKKAFGQCLECHTPYVLQKRKTTTTTNQNQNYYSPKKRLSFLFRDAFDCVIGIVIVQVILGAFALVFWSVAAAMQDDDTNEAAEHENNNTFLYDCQTVRCVIGISYLGGVALFVGSAGLLGCLVYWAHDCDLGDSVEAVGGERRHRNRGGGGGCCSSMDGRCGSSNNYYCDDCSSGDACCCFVILLAVVGIVLAAVGFLFGCFVALVGIQALVQRYLWRIQYRRLLEEYPVRDRNSIEVAAACDGSGRVPEAPGEHDGYQALSQEDLDRLRNLGLLD